MLGFHVLKLISQFGKCWSSIRIILPASHHDLVPGIYEAGNVHFWFAETVNFDIALVYYQQCRKDNLCRKKGNEQLTTSHPRVVV